MRRATVLLLGALLLVSGCGLVPGSGPDGPPVTLRVLAGSELTDLQPLLDEAAAETGVTVELTGIGTLAGADLVASGEAERRHDAIWFASQAYLSTLPGAAAKLGPSVPIASSPVVLGLRRSVAARLGWVGRPVTWSEIAEAAGARRFSFGMTDPSASNSGFSAVVSVATALAGTGAALTAEEAARTDPGLRAFFSAQTMTAGSSAYLVDAFARRATGADPGPPAVDGLINYESVLTSLNRAGTLPEPLEIIRPADGVVTATYPFTLLTTAPPELGDGFRRLTAWLRTPDVQREIAQRTHRRPAVGGVPGVPPPPVTPELPFPARADVVETLLATWFNRIRRPSRTLYVLDTSGSMGKSDDRIGQLRRALDGLAGGAPGALGRFSAFRGREQVTLLPFATAPGAPIVVEVPETDPASARARIAAASDTLRPGGKTAIYDALIRADALAAGQIGADPDRFTSIVLMTDGELTAGAGPAAYARHVADRPPGLRGVPVFCVLFGESDPAAMAEVARLTGGKVFDARTTPLERIFREIRGYV